MADALQKNQKTGQEILQEKVMRLEMAIVMLMNGLRLVEDYPKPILDRVERLIVSE